MIPRPRLIRYLNEGRSGKLTLVAAPAGFGKTTLVVDWLSQLATDHACWLSLDENDNHLPRFFSNLIVAAQTVYPDLAQGLLSSLRLSSPDDGAILSALMHELSALEGPLVFVLDDYHAISNEDIHGALSTLIDYLPPTLHLVITSRNEPPLPFSRWRVRGQLTEIRADDLRFTIDEAAAFLQRTMGLRLDQSAIATLESRTEGWIAGLQLAALSLQGTDDAGRFIADFGGSNRHVADYLLEEVLHRQPPEMQDFLLHTSILSRFTASLCDAVRAKQPAANHGNADSILRRLDEANLFLIHLDAHRRWYRYHHLFAELLQDRLLQEQGQAQVNRLHLRAAQWFEGQGVPDEAVHHAIHGQDFDEAARLMATIPSERFWEQANIGLLTSWGQTIPDTALKQHPRAAILIAWAGMITNDFRHLDHLLELCAGAEAVRGEYALIQCILVRNQGDFIQALHLAREAGEFLAEDDFARRAAALMQMAINMFNLGELASAEQSLLQARNLLATNKVIDPNIHLQIIHMQAFFMIVRADYYQAAHLFQEGIALAEQNGAHTPPMIGIMLAGLGQVSYQWNELEQAAAYYAQARDWGDRTGISDITTPTLLGEIDLLCQAGDIESVQTHLQQLRSGLAQSQLQDAIAQIELVIATYQLRLKQLEPARRWANACGLSLTDQPTFVLHHRYLILAAVRLAECRASGQNDQVPQIQTLLEGLLQLVQTADYKHDVIEVLILLTLAHNLAGDKTAALNTLQQALALAEPGSLVRVFIDAGPELAPLLAECEGIYAHRLREAFERDLAIKTDQTADSVPTSPPLDLTPREYEVLQEIVAGLSNKEIEEKLVISRNTVRTHIKNLYSKLHVTSRTQAIKKARDLELV